jgi:predicted HicB family RNase H-like nuclease
MAVNPDEPTRVITVRLPKCLHEALRAEAHEHRTSMNKLCISKLLQFIDEGMVPADA